MRNFIIFGCFCILFYSKCSGKKEYCTTIGVVDKVMWAYKLYDGVKKNIYFSFVNDSQYYTFKEEFPDNAVLNTGDSILLQFECKNPKKAKFLKFIAHKRNEKQEAKFIPLQVKGSSIKAYHSVDQKPLFKGAKSDKENDTAIDLYIKDKMHKMSIQEHGVVAIDLTINKQGKVVEAAIISSDNQNLNNAILSIIKEMPYWQPAIHKGEVVNVDFLVEIKL